MGTSSSAQKPRLSQTPATAEEVKTIKKQNFELILKNGQLNNQIRNLQQVIEEKTKNEQEGFLEEISKSYCEDSSRLVKLQEEVLHEIQSLQQFLQSVTENEDTKNASYNKFVVLLHEIDRKILLVLKNQEAIDAKICGINELLLKVLSGAVRRTQAAKETEEEQSGVQNGLKEQIASQAAVIGKLKEEAAGLVQLLRNAESIAEPLKRENEIMKVKVNSVSLENTSLVNQLQNIRTENEKQTKGLISQGVELNKLTEDVNSLKNLNESLEQQISDLKKSREGGPSVRIPNHQLQPKQLEDSMASSRRDSHDQDQGLDLARFNFLKPTEGKSNGQLQNNNLVYGSLLDESVQQQKSSGWQETADVRRGVFGVNPWVANGYEGNKGGFGGEDSFEATVGNTYGGGELATQNVWTVGTEQHGEEDSYYNNDKPVELFDVKGTVSEDSQVFEANLDSILGPEARQPKTVATPIELSARFEDSANQSRVIRQVDDMELLKKEIKLLRQANNTLSTENGKIKQMLFKEAKGGDAEVCQSGGSIRFVSIGSAQERTFKESPILDELGVLPVRQAEDKTSIYSYRPSKNEINEYRQKETTSYSQFFKEMPVDTAGESGFAGKDTEGVYESGKKQKIEKFDISPRVSGSATKRQSDLLYSPDEDEEEQGKAELYSNLNRLTRKDSEEDSHAEEQRLRGGRQANDLFTLPNNSFSRNVSESITRGNSNSNLLPSKSGDFKRPEIPTNPVEKEKQQDFNETLGKRRLQQILEKKANEVEYLKDRLLETKSKADELCAQKEASNELLAKQAGELRKMAVILKQNEKEKGRLRSEINQFRKCLLAKEEAVEDLEDSVSHEDDYNRMLAKLFKM